MSTATTGNCAEAAILHAFVEHGIDVLVPFGGGQPYDLVVAPAAGMFVRVQCKAAWPCPGGMTFNSRSTDHGRGRQSYDGLADLFGVHFAQNRGTYLIPVSEVPNYVVRLRLEPTRNHQRRGIRFACDYELARWTRPALVELAARLP